MRRHWSCVCPTDQYDEARPLPAPRLVPHHFLVDQEVCVGVGGAGVYRGAPLTVPPETEASPQAGCRQKRMRGRGSANIKRSHLVAGQDESINQLF